MSTGEDTGQLILDDCWDAAVIDFCRSRYPLSLEPILVRTSTNVLNDIYAIVPSDELHEACAWHPLTAIYVQGEVKCYTVGSENGNSKYGNARLMWRNPHTKEVSNFYKKG